MFSKLKQIRYDYIAQNYLKNCFDVSHMQLPQSGLPIHLFTTLPILQSMKRGQRGILKLLAEGGNWFTPANIAFNIDMSQDYISKECRSLTDQGFLKRHSGGTNPFYQVRDQGRIALEEDSLEFTCEYEGQVSEDLWAVLVYPGRRPLRVAGDQYYGSGEISWGPQGGDGGAFNLAQNLLRHAVSDEAAEEHAFEFYRDTTRTLEKNFRLTEADIEDWVAEQQQAVDE